MRTVYVGVSHDNDRVVAQLIGIKLFPTNAAAQRREQLLDVCAIRTAGGTSAWPMRPAGVPMADTVTINVEAIIVIIAPVRPIFLVTADCV